MMLYIIPYLFYSCISLLCILLQADFFTFLQIFNAKPDLLLLIALMAGIQTGRENGAVAGAVIGFWADILIGGYFGVHILVYALMGYIFGAFGNRLNLKNYIGYFVVGMVGSLLSGVLFLIAYGLVGQPLSFGQNFGGIVLPTTFYNSLLILLAFPIIFIYRRFRGLKVGYVDMFGGGIIFITGNEKVNMAYVEKRKADNRSHRKKSDSKKKHSHSGHTAENEQRNLGKKETQENKKGNRRRWGKEKEKKSRPTFQHKKGKNVKKKKPRSYDHDERW